MVLIHSGTQTVSNNEAAYSAARAVSGGGSPPYLDGVIFFVSIIIITCTPIL